MAGSGVDAAALANVKLSIVSNETFVEIVIEEIGLVDTTPKNGNGIDCVDVVAPDPEPGTVKVSTADDTCCVAKTADDPTRKPTAKTPAGRVTMKVGPSVTRLLPVADLNNGKVQDC